MTPRKCGSCDKSFIRNKNPTSCSACKRKYHVSCTNLSEAEAAVLPGSSSIKFFCILCKENVDHILNNYEKFQKVSDTIEKMKAENESRLAEFEKRLIICETEEKTRMLKRLFKKRYKSPLKRTWRRWL